MKDRICFICGCTDFNCTNCVEKTGEPCKYSGGATVDDFTDGGTYYLAYEYPMTQKSFKVQVSTY